MIGGLSPFDAAVRAMNPAHKYRNCVRILGAVPGDVSVHTAIDTDILRR
jgi:hypothetical protein